MRTSGITAVLALLTTAVLSKPAPANKDANVDIKMPGVQPQKDDTYLCLPMKMADTAKYITGFRTHANMSTAHHVLLYGCTEPGNTKEVWNCGEMASKDPSMENKPVCASGSKIVYAWAMDAPALNLPKDVAFKVGGDTDIKWLVLQVHYKDASSFIPPKNAKDSSGIVMRMTEKPQKKRAGVYLLMTGGEIPAHSTVYMEAACSYNEKLIIHPFAYRAHAHVHGQVISGYRVRDNKWTEIGRVSPKKPQMFYNVTTPGMNVKDGDVLAARCTMVNKEDRPVDIGSTQQDEMCNFYIMYWVEGDKIPEENMCFTDGPPQWNWADFMGLNLKGLPASASIIPGTQKVIEATKAVMNEIDNRMNGQDALIEKYVKMMNKFGLSPNEDENPYDPDESFGLPQSYQGEDDLENPFLESFNGYEDQLPVDLENRLDAEMRDEYRNADNGVY